MERMRAMCGKLCHCGKVHDDNDRCRENTLCVRYSVSTIKLKYYLNWQ